MSISRRVVVRGRVQAVGFRAACRQQARSAGVAGWVTNRSDGAVEALFEGPSDAVAAMLAWVRHGPPGARVDEVSESEEEPRGRVGFDVG
jgi:acylphosphatase